MQKQIEFVRILFREEVRETESPLQESLVGANRTLAILHKIEYNASTGLYGKRFIDRARRSLWAGLETQSR